jgi:hypothetical protein
MGVLPDPFGRADEGLRCVIGSDAHYLYMLADITME